MEYNWGTIVNVSFSADDLYPSSATLMSIPTYMNYLRFIGFSENEQIKEISQCFNFTTNCWNVNNHGNFKSTEMEFLNCQRSIKKTFPKNLKFERESLIHVRTHPHLLHLFLLQHKYFSRYFIPYRTSRLTTDDADSIQWIKEFWTILNRANFI